MVAQVAAALVVVVAPFPRVRYLRYLRYFPAQRGCAGYRLWDGYRYRLAIRYLRRARDQRRTGGTAGTGPGDNSPSVLRVRAPTAAHYARPEHLREVPDRAGGGPAVTTTLADDGTCAGCGARAASCDVRRWLSGGPCCSSCHHASRGANAMTLTLPLAPIVEPCTSCGGSADGCGARRAFASQRCCARCAHRDAQELVGKFHFFLPQRPTMSRNM